MQNSKLQFKIQNFRKKITETLNFELLTFNFWRSQSGQILVVVFIVLGVVLFTVLSVIAGAQIYFVSSTHSIDAEKATALAEAGLDKAVASLNKTGGSYSGEAETNLGDGSYSVEITSKDAGTKIVKSTGYLPNKQQPKVKRTVTVQASAGVGVAFNYGVQVGEGGLALDTDNIIYGSVYSNGNITSGSHDNVVTGDAWVAGGTQPTADQQTDCDGVNCDPNRFIFGKNVGGNNQLDVAQSFKPQTSAVINKASLKLKKIGSPADITVRILADNGGSPDKNNVLTSGTLISALVTSSYSFIDVTFTSTPSLVANTTYWLMVDTSSNNTNYWSWQNDLAQSYNRGSPKWSDDWSAKNPTWTAFSGDLSFKIYMGGVITSIDGGGGLTVQKDAHANTLKNMTIQKDAYFQTVSNVTINGTQHPGSTDPPPKVFPISDANVTEWKNQAEAAGPISGPDCNPATPWGPGKISDSVTLGTGCNETTIKSPIWITGNFTAENDTVFKLDPSYGSTSGLIMVDGQISFKNNNHLEGTGVGSSLLMMLSSYDSRSNGMTAIDIKNNGNTGVFYANNGIISPGMNNSFKELTAWGITLVKHSTINYETGLSSTLFSSGPSGSFSLIKGTYQAK